MKVVFREGPWNGVEIDVPKLPQTITIRILEEAPPDEPVTGSHFVSGGSNDRTEESIYQRMDVMGAGEGEPAEYKLKSGMNM